MNTIQLSIISFITASSVLLTGCAGGLAVKVDVLDKGYMDYLNQRDSLRKEARALAIGDFNQTARFLGQAEYAIESQANSTCYAAISKKLPNISDAKQKENLKKSLEDAANRPPVLGNDTRLQLKYMRETLTKVDRETSSAINRYYGVGPWMTTNQTPLPQPLIELIASRRSSFEQAALHRDRLIAQMTDECMLMFSDINQVLKPADIQAIKTETVRIVQAGLDESIIGGGVLLSDKEGGVSGCLRCKYYQQRAN